MSEYFSHDYNARNDLDLKKLFIGEGLSGVGLYWCLVEMLYEKNGYIDLEYIPIIAFDLRTTEEQVNNVIDKYDLFCKNDTQFFSNSVLKRLDIRNEKSEKARKSIESRWKKEEKKYDRNTTVIRPNNECNTIKEKESKVNNLKNKEKECIEKETTPFELFVEKYSINCDNYSGVINEIDFGLLDKAFSESKWLQENFISLSKICKKYKEIVAGAYKDFTKPKETTEQLTDVEFLIKKGFSKEWVMALTEEERAEKRKKWES